MEVNVMKHAQRQRRFYDDRKNDHIMLNLSMLWTPLNFHKWFSCSDCKKIHFMVEI